MSRTKSYIDRLALVMKRLSESDLVKNKRFDNDALNDFKSVISIAIPMGDIEIGCSETVRHQYNSNRDAYMNYIKQTHQHHLFLLMDGQLVAMYLGLGGQLFIRWNKERKSYDVERVRPREEKASDGGRDFQFVVKRNGRRPNTRPRFPQNTTPTARQRIEKNDYYKLLKQVNETTPGTFETVQDEPVEDSDGEQKQQEKEEVEKDLLTGTKKIESWADDVDD
jgi:hypothetical protein